MIIRSSISSRTEPRIFLRDALHRMFPPSRKVSGAGMPPDGNTYGEPRSPYPSGQKSRDGATR
ncbi:MAG: hypothetical protein CSB33_00890 [Desulfobacterales bacterium]|nr:MAG: hypothetical protein CSB33_00890 [Desulfobacterales bacterium]